MSKTDVNDLVKNLDRQNRLLARKLRRSEQALQLLQGIQRGNTNLQKSLLREIEAEKEKSDRLLRNILPMGAIHRLSRGDTVIADSIDSATVIFSDLVGFTPASAKMSASALVRTINNLYSAFDDAAQRIGVEKIKTIGDAYLAATGLTGDQADHAKIATEFALEIRDIICLANEDGSQPWRMRVGLHSGALTAGVIGKHKFAYDIWGDTVNIASRIQSVCPPGEVLISAFTADLLSDRFHLADQGEVELKGRGTHQVYLVDRFK